jgi:quinol monooxygenase YgiN
MIYKVAEFSIKTEELEVVKKAIDTFVKQVREKEPDTYMYESVPMDAAGFVHFMAFKDENAQLHHSQTPYVQEFVNILYPRCDREPVFIDLANRTTEN